MLPTFFQSLAIEKEKMETCQNRKVFTHFLATSLFGYYTRATPVREEGQRRRDNEALLMLIYILSYKKGTCGQCFFHSLRCLKPDILDNS